MTVCIHGSQPEDILFLSPSGVPQSPCYLLLQSRGSLAHSCSGGSPRTLSSINF